MLERPENLRYNMQVVDLESLVPREHLLRKIDQVVDFKRIYSLIEPYYQDPHGSARRSLMMAAILPCRTKDPEAAKTYSVHMSLSMMSITIV